MGRALALLEPANRAKQIEIWALQGKAAADAKAAQADQAAAAAAQQAAQQADQAAKQITAAWQSITDSLFKEVQRSNMSKACNTEEEAMKTIQFYKDKDGTECYYRKEGEKWLVYRKSDNKTIKSVGYSPADLESILK